MDSTKARNCVVAAYLVAVAAILYGVFLNRAYDDPFITYRYAENLRSGLGFVYNPGERVLSTTTPLYAMLLAALSYLWPDLPHLSNLISVLSLVSGAYFLYRLGKSWDEPEAGFVGALMFPLSALMISTLGAETCFYVTLILGALSFYAEEKHRLAMFLAALVTLTRSDGVLVAGILGLGYLLRYRRIPWTPVLVFVLTVVPWYVFSWFYFGSPFPVTLAAKQQQGQMAISQRFAPGLLALLKSRVNDWRLWLSAGVLVLGWGYALIRARQWLHVLGWAIVYFLGYTLLGVSRYFWYYAPFVPVAVVGVGLGVAVLHRCWSIVASAYVRRALSVGVLLMVLIPQSWNVFRLAQWHDTRVVIYRDVGIWLEKNTPPDARVGTLEVGIIGYYAKRPIVGFAGLIQPDVAQQMATHSTYADTALWAMDHYRPDYLVINPKVFPESVNRFVEDHCWAQQVFEEAAYGGQLVVYACNYVD